MSVCVSEGQEECAFAGGKNGGQFAARHRGAHGNCRADAQERHRAACQRDHDHRRRAACQRDHGQRDQPHRLALDAARTSGC